VDKQTVITLFESAVTAKASDIHVAVGAPLLFRIDGNLIPQTKQEMTADQALGVVQAVLNEKQYKRFTEEKEIDVSFALKGGTRLRVNCSFERGNVTLVARIVPSVIPTLEELQLLEIAQHIYRFDDGLILFTGPTGMGKSTSLAAILQTINAAESHHIITLEDPIEFLFPKGKCLVRQREYEQDFRTFPEALKRVLRQDPNIILVGEMRDPETITAALTLAETGHLIFGTLHTPNTMQTIDRIIDAFPPHQQSQIRSQLSLSLKMVVAQKLLPKTGGGRIALREVLINTPAVSNTIRDARTQELVTVMQTSENIGMVTFAKSAEKLLKQGLISKETYDFHVPALK
jgi:twitching motility protein PilT